MKRWLAILVAVTCSIVSASAAVTDWRADLTPPKPGKFPLLRPLTAHYRFGWGAVTAAEADFDFTKTHQGPLSLAVKAQTVGIVRGLWAMDTQHTALCAAPSLRPISMQQTEVYKGETDKTTVSYAPDFVLRLRESTPAGANPAKTKRFKCPNLYDLHSALLFLRSQPLQDADTYRLLVYPTTSAYLVKVDVIGREKITVAGKSYPAIKLAMGLQHVTKDLQLEAHAKFKQATVWISDDRDRLPLKIDADVFVGHVWAELQSVTYADAKL